MHAPETAPDHSLSVPLPKAVVSVRNLIKTFPSSAGAVHVVNDVTFDISGGQIAAIVGPSGSGKTTLLTMLGCILKPTSGTINIMGVDVSQLDSRVLHIIRSRFIGFIFQGFNLFPHLTVLENVLLAYTIKGQKPGQAARKEAIASLERFGLKERVNFFPRDLSGGQRQRVAIARALVLDPPLILADEPTGNLDQESAKTVIKLLRELVRESHRTVVIVTHDPHVAEQADRVLRVDNGRVQDGTHAS